ncbi:MAG: hypothetical protein HKO59_08815 [Phycisphaerales bacterium]|nr:hypothetical protein [Phycisphaerae bacterium]NNF42471.1 hypothetical protein [Phycisphaerales bacterium]NNM26070.1 hypothetical protein [Phycisphaerales bacterium]
MRSRRDTTVVMTDLGSFFFLYFPMILLRRRFRVVRVFFSPASRTRLDAFMSASRLKQLGRMMRAAWRERSIRPIVCYGYLMFAARRVALYDPATFTPVPADYLCCLGFLRRIPREQINASASSSNIHWSLLPKYAGCHPLYWALRNGERETGVTIHQINEDYDAGPILLRTAIPIAAGETAADLRPRCRDVSRRLFRRYLRAKCRCDAAAVPQPVEDATFHRVPPRSELQLTAGEDADTLRAKFRAAGPGGCTTPTPEGERVVLALEDAVRPLPPLLRPVPLGELVAVVAHGPAAGDDPASATPATPAPCTTESA